VTIPPRPATFAFDLAAPGCEVQFVTFWRDRAFLDNGRARLQLVHTNAASREGSIESAWNWAHAKPNSNTLPHYQVDRSGRARKMLPSNRRGIANATSSSAPGYNVHGNVRNWSLAYETADTGTLADPGISAFTDAQIERVATILAYESITAADGNGLGIPLEYPSTWYGPGTACHTEPFSNPYWTLYAGKTCPGAKKKQQMRERVLPRARQIAAAWLGPVAPPPPPPAPVPPADGTLLAHGWYYVQAGESPWSVAEKIWGSGLLHPALTARNPGTWKPGQFIEIPDLPTVVVTVQAGEGPWAVIRKALPGEDPGSRLAAFYAFNGGEGRTLRPLDVVSVPVFWSPR
jgi:hypothetical protein